MSLSTVFSVICLQLTFALLYAKNADDLCGYGWTPFGQEKCFRAFRPRLSYVDAQSYCARRSQLGGYLRAHLAKVTSKEEQDFLLHFLSTQKKEFANGSFWLGAIKRGSEQSFSWASDGEELSTFTNWSPGRPSLRTDALDYCLQMTVNSSGLWSDEPCTQQKHVLCERPPQLMLEKMHRTLIEFKKTTSNEALTIASKLENATSAALSVANEALTTAKSAVDTATSMAKNAIKVAVAKAVLAATDSAVPLGFIYVQLPKEKSPQEIWPSRMSWTDISSQYDSTFFRVAGSKAEAFGTVQEEFSPYIDEIMHYGGETSSSETQDAKISRSGGWTGDVLTAYSKNGNDYRGYLTFHTAPGEVRPRNMAIKVWKRTG